LIKTDAVMNITTNTISTPTLETKKTISGIIAGGVITFIIYLIFSFYWVGITTILELSEAFTTVSVHGTIILLKLLMGFLAGIVAQAILIPFMIKQSAAKDGGFQYSARQILTISIVLLLGLTIQYFIISKFYASTNTPGAIHLLIPFLIAMLMFFIPWYPFIAKYKTYSYRWIALGFSFSAIYAAILSIL